MNPMTFLVGTLIGAIGLLGLSACSIPAKEESATQTRQVLIPWWSSDAYKWQAVPLTSLKNLTELDGSAAKFFLSPSSNGSSLAGTQPRIRYFNNKNGVAVMTDEMSQHMVTLYAHMERLQEMDARLGLGEVLRKPRIVGVNVIQSSGGENNALYSPKFDALLFLPYTAKDLPIIVNAGAVAHEHFHSLFQALVGKDIQSKVDTMALVSHPEAKNVTNAFGFIDEDKIIGELEERARYHSFLIRAINEGLADVWGYIYTGDTAFIQKTYSKLSERRLDGVAGPMQTLEVVKRQALRATERGNEDPARAYDLGTNYARILRSTFDKNTSRENLGYKIVSLLKDLKAEILSLKDDQWLSPSTLVGLMAIQAKDKVECQRYLSFTMAAELDSAKYNCNKFPAVKATP